MQLPMVTTYPGFSTVVAATYENSDGAGHADATTQLLVQGLLIIYMYLRLLLLFYYIISSLLGSTAAAVHVHFLIVK